MTQLCFACRTPISSHQAREGEGRCKHCDNGDLYEEDIFIDQIKADCFWEENGGFMLTFQAMTTAAQDRLEEWLKTNIPDGQYEIQADREQVFFGSRVDYDLAYLTFA